jgi:hypothetical protein
MDSAAEISFEFLQPEGHFPLKLRQTTSPKLAPQRTALPWGSVPLQRFQTRAATNTGISNPSCAAPSGFLNLLTRYSALALLALFHARSAHGVETLRGFPLPVAATAFTARCPSSSLWPRYGTKLWRRSEERHVGNARENDTSAPLRRTTPRHRPESPTKPPSEESDR